MPLVQYSDTMIIKIVDHVRFLIICLFEGIDMREDQPCASVHLIQVCVIARKMVSVVRDGEVGLFETGEFRLEEEFVCRITGIVYNYMVFRCKMLFHHL